MFKILGYIILFFLKEIKESSLKIRDIVVYLVKYNFKNNNEFKIYLKENYNYWKNKNNINKTNSKILTTDFVSHVGQTTAMSIMGKYASKIENLENIGLLRNYDIRGLQIFKSFGINNVHFLKYGGIFRKLIFFF